MRCDQYIGLNEWAESKVCGTQEVRETGRRIFSDGRSEDFDRTVEIPCATIEKVGEIQGAWTDVVANLNRYTLPSGEVFEEFVQAEPWSSGPCYFIALKDGEGKVVEESLWTDQEIAAA